MSGKTTDLVQGVLGIVVGGVLLYRGCLELSSLPPQEKDKIKKWADWFKDSIWESTSSNVNCQATDTVTMVGNAGEEHHYFNIASPTGR